MAAVLGAGKDRADDGDTQVFGFYLMI